MTNGQSEQVGQLRSAPGAWQKIAAGVTRPRIGKVSDYVIITEFGDVVIFVDGVGYGKTASEWHRLARAAETQKATPDDV